MGTMRVELDPDPLELGPKRLNGKIAECRGMLSRCEQIFLSVSQDLHWYKRRYRQATAIHALKVQELLTNDPEVRAGRNVTDREAVANIKLRGDKEIIDRLHSAVEDLEAVLVVVRTKRADLKDIQGRLKDQLKVCQEEISLGGRWGNKMKTQSAPPSVQDKEIEDLMDSVLASHESKGLNRWEPDLPEQVSEIDLGLRNPAPREIKGQEDLLEMVEMEGSEELFERDPTKPSDVEHLKGSSSDPDTDSALDRIPEESLVARVPPQKMVASEDLDSFLDILSSPQGVTV
jgi:hypothetical protein